MMAEVLVSPASMCFLKASSCSALHKKPSKFDKGANNYKKYTEYCRICLRTLFNFRFQALVLDEDFTFEIIGRRQGACGLHLQKRKQRKNIVFEH